MARNKKAWTNAGTQTHQEDQSVEEEPAVAVAESPAYVPRPSHEEDPYLTQSDVAERLGVTHTTVGNYIRQRILKAEWRGQRLCVRESALAEFQGKNYDPPAKE